MDEGNLKGLALTMVNNGTKLISFSNAGFDFTGIENLASFKVENSL